MKSPRKSSLRALSDEFPVPLSGIPLEKATTYQLEIDLREDVVVQVGRLGRFRLPAGRYVYTGSARRHLVARLQRHLAAEKTLRWHIDYLLASKATSIVRIYLSNEQECKLNQKVNGEILAPRFGASDCRAGCGSHLKYQG